MKCLVCGCTLYTVHTANWCGGKLYKLKVLLSELMAHIWVKAKYSFVHLKCANHTN